MNTFPKLKTKKNIRQNYCKMCYIKSNRGRQSRVETKRSRSPNILPYLICLAEANDKVNQARFDPDYFIVGVDNHASKTISNQRYHFIRNFRPLSHQHIKGISGQIYIKCRGTVRWKIEYDEVRVHTLDIKDALYVPKSPIYVLCPQYLDQQPKDNFHTRKGKYMANFDD